MLGGMKKPMTVIHIERVDAAIRNEFKAICARKGITMREAILEFIDREIEKEQRRQKQIHT